MAPERLRYAAIGLFAVGAVLSGVGNETGHRWIVVLAFPAFAIGVMFILRARAGLRARVLDPEDKTPPAPPV